MDIPHIGRVADGQLRIAAVQSRPHHRRGVDRRSFHVLERKRSYQSFNVWEGLLEKASVTHEPQSHTRAVENERLELTHFLDGLGCSHLEIGERFRTQML